MKHKQTESAFNATLASRLTGAPQVTPPSSMHMNAAPQGPTKSLEDMLKDSDVKVSATHVIVAEGPGQDGVMEDTPGGEGGVRRRILVQDVVDSPWQPRIKYDETALQALGETLRARGQEELIRVRILPNGKYQLIAGHRRIRAARLIGWAEIDAIVLILSDHEAQRATLLSNETNEGLSDFERALAYKELMTAGFADTQKDVARMAGCSQGRVSQCLGMLKLPATVIDLLEKYPGLLSYRHAKIVQDLVDRYPDGVATIAAKLDTLIDKPDLEPAELGVLIIKAFEKKKQKKPTTEPRLVADKNGRSAFQVRFHAQQIVINIEDGVDVAMASKRTLAALRQFAETLEITSEENI